MTANKHFKRRVRERARRTGESYTAALRNLRRIDAEERQMEWQRIEKAEYGYAVHVPDDWDERPPNLKNSPWETARFGQPSDRRHSMIVFRGPGRPGMTPADVAELVQGTLLAAGYADFVISDADLGGRRAARLDCARHDAGRVWAVREYFVVDDGVRFCLGLGSSVPDEDDALFTAMAERFEILGA
ncbi:hypothetical protein GCM10023194_65490 [Planotetraspora phitsanulokensis]|uniref:Uncharacterized protein n=1 Tax=Planotetraspora phitsanulokensis TaxID=575192 RepID=A0A8J3U9T0_9ACTN|nr:hypothetical protein [Planotetraspora phitsanulokensis]GII38624.1 hypothetical protein Pph01_36270 [Planotetraspora phitsanulokensis]